MPRVDIVFGLFGFRSGVGVFDNDVDCMNHAWEPSEDEEEEVDE